MKTTRLSDSYVDGSVHAKSKGCTDSSSLSFLDDGGDLSLFSSKYSSKKDEYQIRV